MLLALFVFMQFYRPERNISHGNHSIGFLTETNPDPGLRSTLKATCYNCHSAHTEYPWYNNIAPFSYGMANHINKGKEKLDFSEWEAYSTEKKIGKLEKIIETVEGNRMPLKVFNWFHKKEELTQVQREDILNWAKNTKALYQLGRRPK